MSSQAMAKPKSMQGQRRQRLALKLFVLFLAIIFALFPLIVIVSASFNPTGRMNTAQLLPTQLSFDNYRNFFNDPFNPFMLWLWNSIKVSGVTTVVSTALTALAAFAFSRFRFKGRQNMLLGLLLVQVFPSLLAIVAIFLIVLQIGGYISWLGLNSHWGLVMVYLGGSLGINVWLMKGFFDSVPRDLDESARMDGASDWQIFSRIILPLVRPILAVIAVLTFIGTFNDFILARVLLTSTEKLTFMVGIYNFISAGFDQNWGIFAAGAVIGSLPIVVVYLLLQDYIVGGLTAGAVKG